MKHIAIIPALLLLASMAFGQGKTTDIKDEQIGKQKVEVRSGGILKVAGYEISGISNDPLLGDSLNSHLVTEAAVKAYVDANAGGSNISFTLVGTTLTITDGGGSLTALFTGWDTDASNDLTTATSFGGDVSGIWNNLQLGAGSVTGTELATGSVLLSGGDVTGVLPTANGGTGLSTIGTAFQLLRVNTGASGLEYWTPNFLTANQTITLTGAVTGSGTTLIATTLSALGATTSGQVLTWNGTAWAAAASSGGISGLTTNYVTKALSSTTIGNSTLYINGGQAFLNSTTSIGGWGGVHGILGITATSANGNAFLQLVGAISDIDATPFASVQVYNPTSSGTATNPGLFWYTDGTTSGNRGISLRVQVKLDGGGTLNALTVSNAAFTGFGTASPSERAHVVGNVLLTGVIKNANGSAASSSYTFSSDLTTGISLTSAGRMSFNSGGVSRFEVGAAGQWYIAGSAGTSGQIMQSNGAGAAASWVNFPGLTGTAATGQVAHYSGTSTMTGSTAFTYTAGALSLGVAGTQGSLKLLGSSSGTITINTNATAGTWTLTLPNSAGTNGYVLSTNGSGVTSWVAQTGSLPSGTIGQTLTHNGTTWVASSALTNTGANVDILASTQWSMFVGGQGLYGVATAITAQTADFIIVNPLGAGLPAAGLQLYEDNDNASPQRIRISTPSISSDYEQTLTAANGHIGAWLATASTVLDFPDTGANSFSELTISLPNAVVGKPCIVGYSTTVQGIFTAYCASTGSVTIRFTNNAIVSINPTSTAFEVHQKL
jgi:hypothetical protein